MNFQIGANPNVGLSSFLYECTILMGVVSQIKLILGIIFASQNGADTNIGANTNLGVISYFASKINASD